MTKKTIQKWIARRLLPGLTEVQNFEIKPEVVGDSLRVSMKTLKKSSVAREKAAVIRRQVEAG